KTVSRAEATRYVWSSENDRRPAEPPGRLLGQRRGREFLRDAEGRARPRRDVGHADGGAHRAVRLPRGLLQRAAATFGARLSQPAGVRAAARTGSGGNLTQVSTKPRQVQQGHRSHRSAWRVAGRWFVLPGSNMPSQHPWGL